MLIARFREHNVFRLPFQTAVRFTALAVLFTGISISANAQWTDAPIEFRETVSQVIDETPVWNWTSDPEYTRSFQEACVSPDGSKVAFTVRLDHYIDKHIYIMNADGTGIVDITSTLPAEVLEQYAKDVSRLRWNDNGTRLFFFGIYYSDLYYYDVASKTTNLAVAGIADPDFRIPYSVNAEGTEVTFRHNAGYSPALERSISGLFRAPVGGDPVNLVDIYNLPYEYLHLNLLRYLGSARTNGKAFFIWNQDYYGGNATAQWMYDGGTTMEGELSHNIWADQDLDNNLVSADGSRVLYENRFRYPESPFSIGYVDTGSGAFTPIASTFDLNGYNHQHISYDGTKVRIDSELHYQTVFTLADMSMRDTRSYYFQMAIGDVSDMTADNRRYYITTRVNNDTATDRISVVDMAPESYPAAPQVQSISFSDPVLYHGDDSRIKVQAHISDAQGLGNIEWVVLVPIVEGREYPDWPMGREPLSFPTGDPGSVYLRDEGTAGDTTAGDGIFSYNLVATRKGDYDGWNTWFTHYELPAEVGIRVIAKDVDGNYGIADTNLMITNAVPAAPVAGFIVEPQGEEFPLAVTFTDTSTGNISSWEWNFGDDRIGTGPIIDHTYAEDGAYDVTLTVTGPGGSDTYTIRGAVGTVPVAVDEQIPLAFALDAPYPNPFNPATTIGFTLPERLPATLVVYDITGARIATLADETMDAGHYNVVWNGRGDDGAQVSSGMYIIRLTAGAMTSNVRAILVK